MEEKLWLSVLTELRNQEPRDILVCCCVGLSGSRGDHNDVPFLSLAGTNPFAGAAVAR
ncbi:MAG: hypothetical protein ACRDRO_01310 [Pseudonocardiaceae bacterium]